MHHRQSTDKLLNAVCSMTECNAEEELIEDYDTADSQTNNVSTVQRLYSSVFTIYILYLDTGFFIILDTWRPRSKQSSCAVWELV